MKLSDILGILVFGLILILSLFIMIGSIAFAGQTGASKICDDVGYLSTSCQSVEMLEPKYKDSFVAAVDASAEKNFSYSFNLNNGKTYRIYNNGQKEEVKQTVEMYRE